MKKLQLTGTNYERLQQILTEANRITTTIESISKSNLDKETKATILEEHQAYLTTLRTQYQTIKAIINKDRAKQQAELQAKQKQAEQDKAKLLNLYSLKTILPKGMYEELPDKHKAIVSQYITRSNDIGYSIDLAKLTGTITVANHEYTCKELYEFLTDKHPMFSYTNWCYVTPENKQTIYNAYKQLIDETGLLEDIKIYKSLHTKIED